MVSIMIDGQIKVGDKFIYAWDRNYNSGHILEVIEISDQLGPKDMNGPYVIFTDTGFDVRNYYVRQDWFCENCIRYTDTTWSDLPLTP